MIELFEKGGALMYPLALCSVVTLTVILERLYHFLRASEPQGFFEEIQGLIGRGEFEPALERARRAPGPVAALVAKALSERGASAAKLAEALSACGSRELRRLGRNLHVLDLLGRTAPLIGLLGTVWGMVKAFERLATVRGPVDPSLLAGGIWEALLTTVAGLCVAIPALIAHHFFEDRLGAAAFSMKHKSSELLRSLSGGVNA